MCCYQSEQTLQLFSVSVMQMQSFSGVTSYFCQETRITDFLCVCVRENGKYLFMMGCCFVFPFPFSVIKFILMLMAPVRSVAEIITTTKKATEMFSIAACKVSALRKRTSNCSV